MTEINTELSQQIAQMVKDFDADKCGALERSEKGLEEIHKIMIQRTRADLENRFHAETAMMNIAHENQKETLR